jgi:hypothetical protein
MNTAADVTTGVAEADMMSVAWSTIYSAHSELFLFAAAIFAYFVLFMQRPPKGNKTKSKKAKAAEEECKEEDYPTDSYTKANAAEPEDFATLEKALNAGYEAGDYRAVLRCWNSMKKLERAPAVCLPYIVESMQRFKKDMPFILRELKTVFKKFPSECDITCINDLLESLSKRLDSDLMEKIVEMLPSLNIEMNDRSYEVFLNMYFTTRSFQEVKTLVSQMRAKQIPFTTRASVAVIKTALKTGNFDDALLFFRELKKSWTQKAATTPSTAPALVVSQLVDLACKDHRLTDLVGDLRGVEVSEE